MNLTRTLPIAALALAATAWADNLTVSANADIYAAGQAMLPSDGNGGFPPMISFTAGSAPWMSFTASNSTLACDFSISFSAEGGCYAGNTQVAGMNGLSGIAIGGYDMFLAGVFLDDSQPADPAPAALVYDTSDPSSPNVGDAMFNPQVGQVFFIGDGLTGNGTGDPQMFLVPPAATRLFLGFTGDTPGSEPFFNSVQGSVEVAIQPEPEPPGFLMAAGALLLLTALVVKRRDA